MKLKKIASLMLAGVMAVSMLAGCSGKGTTDPENPTDDPIVVPETGIVAAVNNGQDADNDVKINFTSDATLDAALASAVKALGEKPGPEGLTKRVAKTLNMDAWMSDTFSKYYGMEKDWLVAGAIDSNKYNQAKDNANGDVVKRVEVFTISSNAALSEDVAMEQAAKTIDAKIADMKATSYKKGTTVSGQKYCDYSYVGSVSMVSVVNVYGETTYCFAYTIAQTTSVKTLAPAEA